MLYDEGGEELLESAMKKGRGGGNKLPKGAKMKVEMAIGLDKLYVGGEVSFLLQRRKLCKGCRGANPPGRCSKCEACPVETVVVQQQVGPFMMNVKKEVASEDRCRTDKVKHTIMIEQGMRSGSDIVLTRVGDYVPGHVPGDVVVALKANDHDTFKRVDNDLRLTLPISLKEALIGFSKTVKHLDGRQVVVAQAPGVISKPFEVLVLRGEGMPVHTVPSEKGDMKVKLDIQMPAELDDASVGWVRDQFPD